MDDARVNLFLFTSYPLWSETFIRQDLKFLQETEERVTGVALYGGDCLPEPDWPKVAVLSSSAPPKAVIARRTSPWRKCLRNLLPKAVYTRLSLLRHLSLCSALGKFAREHHAKHIHAEFAELGALVASHVARQLNITYSVGIHAFDIHASKFDLRQLLENATFITVCNTVARDACCKAYPQTAEKLRLIYHGVNLKFWPFIVNRPKETDALRILFIGRIVPKKGIAILLEAVSILTRRGIDCLLSIAGDGPLAQQLKQLADALGIGQYVRWLGIQTPEQLKSLMSGMTCLCAPSIVTPDGDRDGIPNVILEAMASGLPVVASQVGSISEVVSHQTGWPIATPTPQTLADALDDCLASPNEQEKRRQAARRLVEERFDAQKLARQRALLFR